MIAFFDDHRAGGLSLVPPLLEPPLSSPKEVSLTDPQATWVARPSMDPFFAYDANYLIDNKVGIIVDAEAPALSVIKIAVTWLIGSGAASDSGRPVGEQR